MSDVKYAYGAGLKHGYVKVSDGDIFDIEAIINIEGDPQQEDIEVPGDDSIKTTFSSGRKEEITITANAVSMDVIQAITGNTLASSAGGSDIPLGTDSELNPPTVEVGGEITSRNTEGTAQTVKKIWHRVQLRNIRLNAGNGNEMSLVMSGTAYQTEDDIEGNALATKRVATLKIVA